jgi:hypothetical protein
MATWAEFAAGAPAIAAAGEDLLRAFTVGYLATVRPDGSPRIHPVTVTLHDGGLFVNALAGTLKAADLDRDGRYALHSFPRPWSKAGWDDEELMLAGRARLVTEPMRRAAVIAVHNDAVAQDDLLFELHIERAFHKARPGGVLRHETWREREAGADGG